MNRAEQQIEDMRARLDRIEEERVKFEEWASLECGVGNFDRFGFGYRRISLDCMWLDWAMKKDLL